jgi:hypothetical protein
MTADFVLKFGAETIPIDAHLFACFSLPFSRELSKQPRLKLLDWTDPVVSASSFRDFVNCCQLRSYSITPANAYELHYLGIRFSVGQLVSDYHMFKDHSANDVLISKVIVKYRLKIPSHSLFPLLQRVARNFEDFLVKGHLDLLPFELVQKVVHIQDVCCSHSRLCNFLLRRGGPFLRLLNCLNQRDLTTYELQRLAANGVVIRRELRSRLISIRQSVEEREAALSALGGDEQEEVDPPELDIAEIERGLKALEDQLATLGEQTTKAKQEGDELKNKAADQLMNIRTLRARVGLPPDGAPRRAGGP